MMAGPDQVKLSERGELKKDAVRELFADDADVALFYFAGHGYIEETGGFCMCRRLQDRR